MESTHDQIRVFPSYCSKKSTKFEKLSEKRQNWWTNPKTWLPRKQKSAISGNNEMLSMLHVFLKDVEVFQTVLILDRYDRFKNHENNLDCENSTYDFSYFKSSVIKSIPKLKIAKFFPRKCKNLVENIHCRISMTKIKNNFARRVCSFIECKQLVGFYVFVLPSVPPLLSLLMTPFLEKSSLKNSKKSVLPLDILNFH